MARALLIRFWTDLDRNELKKLFAQGWPVQKIARRLKRSLSAVRREMVLLRLSMREQEGAVASAGGGCSHHHVARRVWPSAGMKRVR